MEKEMIVIILNSGYAEMVMNEARKAGAKGGTVVSAKGSGNPKNEEAFGINIQTNKEIIFIACNQDIRDKVLLAVNRVCNIIGKEQGIVFTLPIIKSTLKDEIDERSKGTK